MKSDPKKNNQTIKKGKKQWSTTYDTENLRLRDTKTEVNSGPPERKSVPAPHMVTVVLKMWQLFVLSAH